MDEVFISNANTFNYKIGSIKLILIGYIYVVSYLKQAANTQ